MSTVEHNELAHGDHGTAHDADHHPSDRKYIEIALILGVITALEVLTYFVDFGAFMIPSLMIMMVAKFAIVALWFMHLRFDSRLFRRLFVTGLVTAAFVYLAALTMFHFWSEDDNIDSTTRGETVGIAVFGD
jgi:cytochrome c oxidase subunit IV